MTTTEETLKILHDAQWRIRAMAEVGLDVAPLEALLRRVRQQEQDISQLRYEMQQAKLRMNQ